MGAKRHYYQVSSGALQYAQSYCPAMLVQHLVEDSDWECMCSHTNCARCSSQESVQGLLIVCPHSICRLREHHSCWACNT
jgi:hypothetical protein